MSHLELLVESNQACTSGDGIYFATGYYAHANYRLGRHQIELGRQFSLGEEVVELVENELQAGKYSALGDYRERIFAAGAAITRLCFNSRHDAGPQAASTARLELVDSIAVVTPDAKETEVTEASPYEETGYEGEARLSTGKSLHPVIFLPYATPMQNMAPVTKIIESYRGGDTKPVHIALRGIERIITAEINPEPLNYYD